MARRSDFIDEGASELLTSGDGGRDTRCRRQPALGMIGVGQPKGWWLNRRCGYYSNISEGTEATVTLTIGRWVEHGRDVRAR
jgi:hypothetical protein